MLDSSAGLAHLRLAFERLEEDDVRAGFAIGDAALERALKTVGLPRVCAGDDQGVLAAPGLDRDLHLLDHVDGGHHTLERRVAALLGEFLVLDLDRRNARFLVAPHGVVDVEQAAVAGVGIGDDGGIDGPAERRDPVEHLGVACDARVGQAVGGSRRRCSTSATSHSVRNPIWRGSLMNSLLSSWLSSVPLTMKVTEGHEETTQH